MKTKRIFVLVFALVLSIASVFTVAAASDDVLIEIFKPITAKTRICKPATAAPEP